MAIVQSGSGNIVVVPGIGAPGVSYPGPPGNDGAPGPTGPQGPPGESAAKVVRTAAARIPARRMVVDVGNGQIDVADPTNPDQAGLVVGFVKDECLRGYSAEILQGDLTNIAFDFGFGIAGPLYTADDGSLTRVPRLLGPGFFQVVGWTADGVSAVIRLGPARVFASLNGGGGTAPTAAENIKSLIFSAAADPVGLMPGSFYTNSGILERTPSDPDPSISITAISDLLGALFDTLPLLSDASPPGSLGLNGRALAVSPGGSSSGLAAPSTDFLRALGALWDGLPTSPDGLGSKKFYRNGNALERTP